MVYGAIVMTRICAGDSFDILASDMVRTILHPEEAVRVHQSITRPEFIEARKEPTYGIIREKTQIHVLLSFRLQNEIEAKANPWLRAAHSSSCRAPRRNDIWSG